MAFNGSFKKLKDVISTALVNTTRTAGQISNEDLIFQRSSNPSIVPLLDQQSSRLLNLAQHLAKVSTLETEVLAPQVSDADAVEDNWGGIVDVLDNLLERTDACLDEYTGIIKKLSPSQEEKIKKTEPLTAKQMPRNLYRHLNIEKPQLLFKKIPTNDETAPFKPLLRSKPHAMIPLEQSLKLDASEEGSKQYDPPFHPSLKDALSHRNIMIDTQLRYKHPYETEIESAQYPPTVYTNSEPIPPLPYDTTKATLVDTPEAVAAMLEELKEATEIAVDLEHHDEHSYIGIVSLMQISTRDKDWVVDTLKPWREDIQILNEVFADPRILKVFHGSSMDIIWLQRDLGLYVVGLFDTYHASHSLGYPKHSLAYLLKEFVNFDAAKQYQMADWRIRPLPEEMFNYARSDTHFLLYIYDNMRNQLIDNSNPSQPDGNLVEEVMKYSKLETLQRYERPLYDELRGSGPGGWYNMLCRTPALFNREQFAVFRAVHQWRDSVARQEDESVHSILPKHVLYNIAREIPVDMPALLGCSHPMSKPFQKRKQDLLGVIRRAKVAGVTSSEMGDVMKALEPVRTDDKTNGTGASSKDSIDKSKAVSAPAPAPGNRDMTRSSTSKLWGATLLDDTLDNNSRSLFPSPENFYLALPLPQLTAELFADGQLHESSTTRSHPDPGARAEHQYVEQRKTNEDDIFTVKQAGGSRKRKVAYLESAPEAVSHQTNGETRKGEVGEEMDVMSLGEGEDEQAEAGRKAEERRQKHERRLEKKRLKQEKEDSTEGAEVVGSESGASEAFDYSNAPSVLHLRKVDTRKADASRSVNPYAKSMDAPSGARRSKKEGVGRSMTYKS